MGRYEVVAEAPDFNNLNVIIGEQVLYQWTGAPLNLDEFGWYRGKVARKISKKKELDQGLTFEVRPVCVSC